MKNILIIIAVITCGNLAYAQNETPFTLECISTPFHVDEIYITKQMHCIDGVLSIDDEHPCKDIYYENGFIFYTGRFKHQDDPNPVGTFGDIYFRKNNDDITYVELISSRMFITTPTDIPTESILIDIQDISQNGLVFGYNKPSELNFYESLEALDDAFEHVHWNGAQLYIDEPVTEFQIGADHMLAKNIIANPSAIPTAVYDVQVEQKLFAYPNPTNDILSFDLASEQLINIDMYDLQGRRVLQEKVIVNSKILVTSLIPGIYIARATTNTGKIYLQKITKL